MGDVSVSGDLMSYAWSSTLVDSQGNTLPSNSKCRQLRLRLYFYLYFKIGLIVVMKKRILSSYCYHSPKGSLCRTSWMVFTSPTAMTGQYYSDGAPKAGLGFSLAPSGIFDRHYCRFTLTVTDPEGVGTKVPLISFL